jgi:type IX secretion system PorP/SprF family membrane protein
MRRYLLILLLAGVYPNAIAQYFQFSQYNFTPTRVNPGWLGLTKYFTVDFDNRNQKTGGDFQINSNFFAAAYPFLRKSTGTPWSGLGISILDDRSAGVFRTQEASLSYAINIPTGKYERLSIGFRGLMRTQRVDYSGLFTGSQYIEGRGFDASVFNGETSGILNNKYFTFSSGFLWIKADRRGSIINQLDGAIFDFNKPNNSFTAYNSALASTLVTHGTFLLKKRQQLSAYSDMLFTYSAGTGVFNIGMQWQYDLNPTSRNLTEKIDLITRYVIGRSGILGIQFHKEKLSIGLSYDFPVVIKNYGNTGALEIGLEYRAPVNTKNRNAKSRLAKKPTPKSRPTQPKTVTAKRLVTKKDSISEGRRDSVIAPAVNQELITVTKNDSSSSKALAKAGKLTHEPLIMEKITLHFHFEYNSVDLDDETEKFLAELSATLSENENLKLKVTGHTDNRGNEKYNQRLSVKRADEVKKYLVRLGIDPARVLTEGKGMTEPVDNNTSEEGRAKNRRVEITMYVDQR